MPTGRHHLAGQEQQGGEDDHGLDRDRPRHRGSRRQGRGGTGRAGQQDHHEHHPADVLAEHQGQAEAVPRPQHVDQHRAEGRCRQPQRHEEHQRPVRRGRGAGRDRRRAGRPLPDPRGDHDADGLRQHQPPQQVRVGPARPLGHRDGGHLREPELGEDREEGQPAQRPRQRTELGGGQDARPDQGDEQAADDGGELADGDQDRVAAE
ncbi:hypothetical protein [Blastococcus sp. KM273128]|uniref:hypothetical protein n=1 Tax=Blastococcus sp. KM273128 TaxID=2570314 RepID=UPI001F3AF825|nr:hypothetical protein [Blastococcus sp. KM273128]